jgi:hypothetical protein
MTLCVCASKSHLFATTTDPLSASSLRGNVTSGTSSWRTELCSIGHKTLVLQQCVPYQSCQDKSSTASLINSIVCSTALTSRQCGFHPSSAASDTKIQRGPLDAEISRPSFLAGGVFFGPAQFLVTGAIAIVLNHRLLPRLHVLQKAGRRLAFCFGSAVFCSKSFL